MPALAFLYGLHWRHLVAMPRADREQYLAQMNDFLALTAGTARLQ